MARWPIFRGDQSQHDDIQELLPDPPPWRRFGDDDPALRDRARLRGETFRPSERANHMVNLALVLRRPLLITGRPGTGKSSLAWAVAEELKLGPVLVWPITTRSTLQDGLYRYDAIARLQDASLGSEFLHNGGRGRPLQHVEEYSAGSPKQPDTVNLTPSTSDAFDPPAIGRYIQLGPVGTALLPGDRPRVLLIDEIDKSDIDLPNDLLHIFEEGGFEIPELSRLRTLPQNEQVAVQRYGGEGEAMIRRGYVRCREFPFVIMTSNAEREFPPAFLRRCLRLDMPTFESEEDLARVIEAHLTEEWSEKAQPLIAEFLSRGPSKLATDQLLNAVWLLSQSIDPMERRDILDAVLRVLTPSFEDGAET
jgi:MoxR-like ATPase